MGERKLVRGMSPSRLTGCLVAIVAICTFIIAPLILDQYAVFFLAQMAAVAYLGLSLDLVYSFGRILSITQGLFFAVAGYATIYAAPYAEAIPGFSLVVLVGAGVLCAALLGGVLGSILVRMQGIHNPTIATLIFSAIGLLGANALTNVTGGEDGRSLSVASVSFQGARIAVGTELPMYFISLMPLAALIFLYAVSQRRTYFKVLRAIAQNETRAEMIGLNVKFRRWVVFTIGSAVAGLGGAFYALSMQHVTTATFDMLLSFNAIVYALVGGLGTAFGALVGVMIVYPTAELVSSIFKYVDIVIGLIMVVVSLYFPKGIVGTLYNLWPHPTDGFTSQNENLRTDFSGGQMPGIESGRESQF